MSKQVRKAFMLGKLFNRSNDKNRNQAHSKSLTVVLGGFYANKKSENSYSVFRMLDVNGGAAHMATYGDFDHIPAIQEITAKHLRVMHLPMNVVNTLLEIADTNTTYIGKQNLTREDLEGYAYWLQEVRQLDKNAMEDYFARSFVGKTVEFNVNLDELLAEAQNASK